MWRLLQKQKIKELCDYAPVQIRRVRFRGKRLSPHPTHGRVMVAGVRQAMDPVASKAAYSRPPTYSECRSGNITRVDGLVLESGPLPEEDIVRVRRLSGMVVATTRFKDFCERHDVKNINLVPVERKRFDPRGAYE